jgi:ribonuclease P protein component
MIEFSFPKSERLTSEKVLATLFKKGKAEFLYPFRLVFITDETHEGLPQVVFSVPKKQFKRAVDRNLLRRRMREAYRLHKAEFLTPSPGKKFPAFLGFVYIAKEKVSFEVIEKKMILLLKRLSE